MREIIDRHADGFHADGDETFRGIANIGSMSAKSREANSDLYVATKSGVEGFSEALAKKANDYGLRVMLIEPGPRRHRHDCRPGCSCGRGLDSLPILPGVVTVDTIRRFKRPRLSRRCLTESDHLTDEHELLYVGITRARTILWSSKKSAQTGRGATPSIAKDTS